jgi:hypothetical protein
MPGPESWINCPWRRPAASELLVEGADFRIGREQIFDSGKDGCDIVCRLGALDHDDEIGRIGTGANQSPSPALEGEANTIWFAPRKVVRCFELEPASDMELRYGQEAEA